MYGYYENSNKRGKLILMNTEEIFREITGRFKSV